jgi:hypothetical protein
MKDSKQAELTKERKNIITGSLLASALMLAMSTEKDREETLYKLTDQLYNHLFPPPGPKRKYTRKDPIERKLKKVKQNVMAMKESGDDSKSLN